MDLKKILRYILLILCLTLSCSINVLAANATLNIKSSVDKVKPGENVTFTISMKGLPANGFGSMRLLIKYDATKFSLVSASEQTSGTEVKNETNGQVNTTISITNGGIKDGTIYKLVLKSLATANTGTSTISVSSNDCWATDGLTAITVTSASKNVTHYQPSTDNNLKSLSVSGCTLNPTFSANNSNYTCQNTDDSSVKITAVANDSKATITGSGTRKLSYGKNKLSVTVTSESGTKKVYNINIERNDKRSSDNTLKELNVEGYNLNFSTSKTEYSLQVPNKTETIKITGKANDTKATITGLGTINLKVGVNELKVVCKAENGSSKTYIIKVIRTDKENIPSTVLTKLSYNGKEIALTNSDKTYLIGVDNTITKLDLIYETSSTTSLYEVTGNDNLNNGINVVKIKVSDTNCDDSIYTLLVNKTIKGTNMSSINELTKIEDDLIFNNYKHNNQVIRKNVFTTLRSGFKKIIYNVVNEYNGLYYSLELDGNVKYDQDLELYLLKTKDNPLSYMTNIPEGIKINLYVENVNNNLSLYSLNHDNNEYTLIKNNANITNNYLEFTTNGDLEYILSNVELINDNNEEKNSNIIYYIIIAGALFLGLISGLLIGRISNNNKKVKSEVIDERK